MAVDDVRRLLHRAVQHDRRHPLRGAGSTHPTRRGGAGMSAILTVEDLRVSFATEDGVVHAVDGVSFDLAAGEVLAIVGESGCGKSVTAQTLIGLTRASNARITGSVNYRGREIERAEERPAARYPRRADRDGLPGSDVRTEPGLPRRRSDHRDDPCAPRRLQERGPRQGGRTAAVGRHPQPRATGEATTRTSSPAVCGSAS